MPATNAPSSENLLLGKGQLFFDRFDGSGNKTGLRHLGNVETFELTISDDKVQKFSSMTAGAPLYKEVNRRRTCTLKVTGNEFHPENMALATMGAQATLAQVATPVVAEAVYSSTIKSAYFVTKKLGPITAVAVKFGATTGVLNTDYAIIDAISGLIRILPGTILTGAVTVDYTPTAYSTNGPAVISGGVSGVIAGYMLFIGDPSTGPKVKVDIWKVNISPDGAIGLISDDFAQMSLQAAILDDGIAHPVSPLFEVTYIG